MFSRAEAMKRQMDSLWTRARAEPVVPPFWAEKMSRDGQLCPGQGEQEVKSHSVYGSLGVLRLTDLAIQQQTVGTAKFFTRSATIHQVLHKTALFCLTEVKAKCTGKKTGHKCKR